MASSRPAPAFRFGPFTLIPTEGLLLKDEEPIPLAPKAFDLLAFLSANPDRLLTKTELMRAVWSDAVVEESNLAYTVFAIRKALSESSDTDRYIETVPKRGIASSLRSWRRTGTICAIRLNPSRTPTQLMLAKSAMYRVHQVRGSPCVFRTPSSGVWQNPACSPSRPTDVTWYLEPKGRTAACVSG